jgi:membrane fusion protein, multidrug efflux system
MRNHDHGPGRAASPSRLHRLGGAAAIALLFVFSACGNEKEHKREEKVPVAVATAEQRDVPLQIQAIGTVQPLSTVAVRALVGGQLTQVWFHEGDEVHKGALLFTIDPRPYEAALAQAQANLARDEAESRNADAERSRYAELITKDYVTQQENDKAIAVAEAAHAVVAADHAAVETAQIQLAYCEIRSPIDGRTGSLVVHAGNIVRANDTTPLVTINQIEPINVQFAIPERQLGEIRAVGSKDVPVDATPQGSTKSARGRLTFIDNSVDPTTGTITLKAAFPNTDRSLWPGQYVNVAITLDHRTGAVLVPVQAVQSGQSGQYVYVVRKDSGIEMRPVKVSQQIDQDVIIDQGVHPGDEVVIDGQIRLTPDSKVEIKNAS